MNVRKLAVLWYFLVIFISGNAQVFPARNYPQNYFQWPVLAKHALAANFGELRPNHYHMGLDCKTDQRENIPVVAAADGYIAKVKIEPFGFGRCIYINHPNGLTTLYAHLNEFYPALEKYITDLQYKTESWKIFVDIPEGLLPVKKGQQIAFSGNTGGSQGPHTHFEIRDTRTDKVLNPFLFGLGLADNISPDIHRLAMYDRCVSTYEQSPKFFSLKKTNGVYSVTPALIITNTDKVSFAIGATDRVIGTPHPYGIYEAVLSDNERPVVGFQIDSISYDETRYVNAQIDYKLRSSGGPFMQHLSRLPGYPEGVYKQVSGDGVIDLTDDSVHYLKIEVKDAAGNLSVVKFSVQRRSSSPAKAIANNTVLPTAAEFRPNFVNVFENDKVCVYLKEQCLYDSFHFVYREGVPVGGFPVYQIHSTGVPLQTKFMLQIKCTTAVRPDKMVMHRFAGSKHDYAKAVYADGGFTASFKEFGNFHLLLDTIPPTITPVGFREGMNTAKLNRLAFVIVDATEELENFSAMLDGKWLRFSNDKGRTFIYKFDEHCLPGKHELKLTVSDCVGNTTEKIYHFTR